MTQMCKGVVGALLSLLLFSCVLTPRPLTMEEIRQRASQDMDLMFADQEPPSGPIGLYEAMARAVLHNLDGRAALMEETLALRFLDVSRFDQLPVLAANAGYSWRNQYHGANSMALTGPSAGAESLTMSTSQEKSNRTAQIGMIWNVLDFGVSYARARQAGDSLLIAEEQRRKVVQNILQDVRYAYWRAVGAENVIADMTVLFHRTEEALERSFRISDERIRPLQNTLEYQQALLENVRLLRGLIHQMSGAKTELAALMNMPPGVDFVLPDHHPRMLTVPALRFTLSQMEESALTLRPELRQEDYRERISAMEARKALLGMLPGIDLNFGYHYDSNDYLYRNNWVAAGTQASMNLFRLFSGPARYRAARTAGEVDAMRRRALSMAALIQVHLAFDQYRTAADEFRVSLKLVEVSDRLARLMADNEASGRSDEPAAIISATNAMASRIRLFLVHAELQNAMGRLYRSAGIDLTPVSREQQDVRSLAAAIEESLREMETRIGPPDRHH